jgi:hypothetical protein
MHTDTCKAQGARVRPTTTLVCLPCAPACCCVGPDSSSPNPALPCPSLRSYEPDTLDINADPEELRWWLGVLREQIPLLVEKAAVSEGGGELPRRRAAAFGRCGRRGWRAVPLCTSRPTPGAAHRPGCGWAAAKEAVSEPRCRCSCQGLRGAPGQDGGGARQLRRAGAERPVRNARGVPARVRAKRRVPVRREQAPSRAPRDTHAASEAA